MKRNGIVLVGGILGVLRGVFGTFIDLVGLSVVRLAEERTPGWTGLYAFEFAVSLAVLGIGIYAIVKSGDSTAGGVILVLGIAIVAAGVIVTAWGFAVLQGTSDAIAALGAFWSLGVVGGLLIFGAVQWRRQRPGVGEEPTAGA